MSLKSFKGLATAAAMTVAGISGAASAQMQSYAPSRFIPPGSARTSTPTRDNPLINLYDQSAYRLQTNHNLQLSWQQSVEAIKDMRAPALPKVKEEAAAKRALDFSAAPILKQALADPSLRSLDPKLTAELFAKLKTYLSLRGENLTAYAADLIKKGQADAALMLALRDDMQDGGSIGAYDQTGSSGETVKQAHAIIDHYTGEAVFDYLARNKIDLVIGRKTGSLIKYDAKQNVVMLPLAMLAREPNGPFVRLGPAGLAVRDIAAQHAGDQTDGKPTSYPTYDWPDGLHYRNPFTNNYRWEVGFAIEQFLPEVIERLEAVPPPVMHTVNGQLGPAKSSIRQKHGNAQPARTKLPAGSQSNQARTPEKPAAGRVRSTSVYQPLAPRK